MLERTNLLAFDLSPENVATLDRMVRAIDLAEGFALFFARCNIPALRRQLMDRAGRQLTSLGVSAIEVALTEATTNLRQRLRRDLQALRVEPQAGASAPADTDLQPVRVGEAALDYGRSPKYALCVTGLEYSIPYDRPDARILAELNLGRDLFRRDVPAPLVLWLPDYALTAVAQHAPDFWAWRSGVFEFTSTAAQRAVALTQEVYEGPGRAALGNLSAAAKLARRRQLESLLDDYRHLPDDDRIARERMAILMDLGHACYVQGDYSTAANYFEQALRLARQVDDRAAQAAAQSAVADVFALMGRPQEALALYEEALRSFQALGDARSVAVTQSKMADVLRQMGRPQEALVLYEESLRTQKVIDDRREIAVTQGSMADALRELGRPREAMALYEQSLRTAQALGDTRGVAVTQSKMADVLRQMDRLEEAVALLEESLRTLQDLGDVPGVAVTQSSMADALRQMGRLQEALALYEKALRTKETLGDIRGIAVTQSKVADLLHQMDRLQEAMRLYQESLRTKEGLGDARGVAVTQNALAGLLREMGRYDEAASFFEQALQAARSQEDVQGIAAVQANYALLLLQQDTPERAISLLWKAYEALASTGYTADERAVQQLLALVKSQEMGRETFDRAWQQAVGQPQPDWLQDV